MKNNGIVRRLPAVMLGLGALCWALRQGLYALALDEKNLLARNHPLEWLLWAAAFAAAALALGCVWKLDGSARYEESFRASIAAAFGHFLLAGGIGVTVLTHVPGAVGGMGAAWKILGFLSVPLLVWAGLCRLRGRMPFFLTHAAVCVFLLVHIMNQYQRWCADPQLMDYIFALLGVMMLAFFAYYSAAFEAGCGKRRMHLGAGLLAVLLCTAALSAGEYPLLYLGGISWALTDLCCLQPPPKEEETAYDAA